MTMGTYYLFRKVREQLGMSPDHPLMNDLYEFFLSWFQTLSPWIIVGVSTERSLAVWVPHKIHIISNTKTVAIYLFLISVATAAFYVVLLIPKESVDEATSYVTGYFIGTALFKSIVPFIIMLIFSLLIVIKIFQSAGAKGLESNQSERRNHIQTSFTVVSVTMTFFILTAPYCILMFYSHFVEYVFTTESASWLPEHVANLVAELLVVVSCSVNFLLYLFTGQKFRKEFVRIMTSCCHREI